MTSSPSPSPSQRRLGLEELTKEIRLLRDKIDKLENIVEDRLVGEVRPDKYERKAVAEFDKRKKAGRLEFVPLSKLEE